MLHIIGVELSSAKLEIRDQIPVRAIIFAKYLLLKVHFLDKILEKYKYLKKFTNNKFFEFSRQCKYLQLEKPSGFEIEIPIQKTLAINLLKGMAKRTPPGSDRTISFHTGNTGSAAQRATNLLSNKNLR